MSSLEVISESDLERLYARAAACWCQEYKALASKNELVVGGWCGGRSPQGLFSPLFECMAQLPEELRRKHRLMLVDERLHEDHNATMLEEKFIRPAEERGLLSQDQVSFYPYQLAETDDHGIAAYSQTLQSFGGAFHYVVLGTGGPHSRDASGDVLGWDCHVAGTFAHHVSTTSEQASVPGFIYYNESPKPPPGRMTATQPLLAQSEVGFLLVIGEGKHGVLDEYLNPKIPLEDCPAKIVRKMKRRVIITTRPMTPEEIERA